MIRTDSAILITGGSGAQGGAAIDALLAAGCRVRALARAPDSGPAQALAARGVELVFGDFDDGDSLAAAMQGAGGVFSVQLPPSPADPKSEVRTGTKLIEAAKAAGVETFVHTSVARAGDQQAFAGWAEGRWWRDYWGSKSAVNDAVRAAGFRHHVILKPAFMMDNFAAPKAAHMFPGLQQGRLVTTMAVQASLDLVAAADVGRFAAAAFLDPERFDGAEIALAADALTMTEVAEILGRVTNRSVATHSMSPEEGVAAGLHSGLVESQQWANVEGYQVDLARARSWGIALTGFEAWATAHRERIMIG